MNLLPRTPKIFDRFDELADIITQSGNSLPKISTHSFDIGEYAKKIRKLELKADKIFQVLMQESDSVFITPIDRDDIHTLSKNLDDITDLIENVFFSLSIYKIKKNTEQFSEIALLIKETTLKVSKLVQYIKYGGSKKKEMRELISQIRDLENKGDDLTRKAVTSLFQKKNNAMIVMQWKDVYEEMEKVLDECENSATIVNEIIIKNF